MSADRTRVARRFGAAAHRYDRHAPVQAETARTLAALLPSAQLPPGPVLEIGCGTGLLTRELLRQMGDRPLQATDLAPAMLEHCRGAAWAADPRLSFAVLDGAEPLPRARFALIASSYALQWLPSPEVVLNRWRAALAPGGWLLVAAPVAGSLPEWQRACERASVPYSGLRFPAWGAAELGLDPSEIRHCRVEDRVLSLADPLDFFRSLRAIGATAADLSPGAGALRRLCRSWPRPWQVTYRTGYLLLQRP